MDQEPLEISIDGNDPTFKQFSPWSIRRLRARIPARVVLYMLSFSGFLVSFVMRNDINLAIIAMVRHPPKNFTGNDSEIELYCYNPDLATSLETNTSLIEEQPNHEEGDFEWDSTVQSTIISSFYWCYVMSQILGGYLTQKLGPKTVFGYSQLFTALGSVFIPLAADFHYAAVVFVRSVQGFASGLTWPAMYAMAGRWIPPKERSRFMSSFQGFSFGIGLTYPLCGWLIANFGWRVVFYVTGSLGFAWCVIWFLLAYDTPAVHPRITEHERRYIQVSLGETVTQGKGLPVPWKELFKSLPVWSIGITTFGRIWVSYTFIISGPMYMKTVLGFAIQKNGLLNGAPFLLSYLTSVVFCYLADVIVHKNVMSLKNVRKMNTAIAQVVPGLICVLIGYLGCDIVPVLVVWFFAVSCITAAYAGAMASIVDIAPNLAGPILAFAQTIHMSASFLSPMVAGFILKENQSLEQWRIVFAVTAIVSVSTYFVFQIYGTDEVQSWNYPDNKPPMQMVEMEEQSVPLKEKGQRKNEKICSKAVPEDC